MRNVHLRDVELIAALWLNVSGFSDLATIILLKISRTDLDGRIWSFLQISSLCNSYPIEVFTFSMDTYSELLDCHFVLCRAMILFCDVLSIRSNNRVDRQTFMDFYLTAWKSYSPYAECMPIHPQYSIILSIQLCCTKWLTKQKFLRACSLIFAVG